MKTTLDFFRFVAFLKEKLLIWIRFVLQAIKYAAFCQRSRSLPAQPQPARPDKACQRSHSLPASPAAAAQPRQSWQPESQLNAKKTSSVVGQTMKRGRRAAFNATRFMKKQKVFSLHL
ncbi:hypothetical protein [Lachnospira multipara]|uniref:hypothetical protein n=1 Tax=Lachnospira multipara TaxID=28051 RepID=UPI0004E27F08|nr:hypothetical protein [Lachnospira multipara]